MSRKWWKSLQSKKLQTQQRQGGRRARLEVEVSEVRIVPDVRSITGAGNNIANPNWGASGSDLLRVSPVAYADGISAPSTPNTLNPRVVSNNLSSQSDPIFSFADNNG